jgi:DNA repair photolyase
VVNPYKGCQNRCFYCYTYSYTKLPDVLDPKCKVEFSANLDKDIQRYEKHGLPKKLVYVSSNCEALQPLLEDKYVHTLYALRKLKEAGFPIIIMTKNPSKLLEHDYLEALDKSKTVIQTTIPFLDSRFEPLAPSPQERIRAIHELVEAGYKVVARVDPIVPAYGKIQGQSRKEINALLEQLHSNGVSNIVSKCMRLSIGIKKLYPGFYEGLKPYYLANGFRESRSVYVLNLNAKRRLMASVHESCLSYGMKLWTCMDNVGFAETSTCDGSEEILQISSSDRERVINARA